MSRLECRSELLQRVRRGLATDADRLALEAHLKSCESCQLVSDLGRDFELAGGADAGDAARLERIAESARRFARGQRPADTHGERARSRSPRWLLLAAAFATLASAAVAATLISLEPEQPRERRLEAPAGASPSAPIRGSAPPAPPASHDSPETTAGLGRAPSARSPAADAPLRRSATELFKSANEARRAGEFERAVRLYRALSSQYPSSPEAALAQVSLGSVLLHSGSPAQALVHFDRYLAAGGGALAAEALYGRGRALASLGRRREETQVWATLLDRHERSPYAAHARRRLAELRATP